MSLSNFSSDSTNVGAVSGVPDITAHNSLSCAELMLEIKTVFGRATPRLAAVFNVSRETLFSWANGAAPAEDHWRKLRELAAAARVFLSHELKPTVAALDLTVARGKSFLSLISEGADGAETAERLVKIVHRAETANARLDAILEGKLRVPLSPHDFGAESFDEPSG